jgi:histidinol-phosphate/aromatic aminotransferase/cobyric acid decarboxylase-like protein
MEVTDNVSTVSEDMNAVHDVIWIPPVVETETVVEDVIHVSVEVIKDVRLLYRELKTIKKFHVYPSGTNFILIKLECGLTATEIQQILLEDYKAYVRDCSNKVGLDNFHIRVASQGKQKDRILINALKEISKKCSGSNS